MKIIFKKFNKEKVKEIGLVSLALMLVGIGYFNFANKDDLKFDTYAKSTNSLGDVELVSSNTVLVENENENQIMVNNIISETVEENIINQETVNTVSNNEVENYFSEVKLNRDIMYDEILETYQKIIDSNTISSEQKSIAVQEIQKITKQKNSISMAEELIRLKGFEDVVILMNDNNINVIVRIAVLTKAQVVQIQNIVMKELQVSVDQISISTK